MFVKTLLAAAGAMLAFSAVAFEANDIAKSVALKDGSTVHVFKDGKMAMEDKFGRAVRMNEGQAMETREGQRIGMVGDEVARLGIILRAEYRGGR